MLVNRNTEYLRKSALSFAQEHDLAPLVQQLYEAEPTSGRSSVRRSSKRQRKKSYRKVHRNVSRSEKLSKVVDHDMIFAWPIEKHKFYLSSPFGNRKKLNGEKGFHSGIDMAAIRGTPVKAAQSGRVIEAYFDKGYGNTILILHSKGIRTRYAHLDKILVVVGQKVEQGQLIGTVGSTGHTFSRKRGRDTSHLHFEIHLHGKKVNPLYYMA